MRLPFGVLLLLVLVLGAAGYVAYDQLFDRTTATRPVQTPAPEASQPRAMTARFVMCGRERRTCIVDGDTIWLNGQNLRLQSFDTPEPRDNICGGQREIALANRASARLMQLLNENPFTVETFGVDGTGSRLLATIRIAGRDVGDILIEEGLARRWPNGHEFWCE
jgi:endonuclease YncB( thermonuclease family)